MSKFKPKQEVWFYCNPDNLNNPVEEGCVLKGVITSVTTDYKTVEDFSDTKTEDIRVGYNVEIVWDDFYVLEKDMFETESEAKAYAKEIMVSRIKKIEERLEQFKVIMVKLDE